MKGPPSPPGPGSPQWLQRGEGSCSLLPSPDTSKYPSQNALGFFSLLQSHAECMSNLTSSAVSFLTEILVGPGYFFPQHQFFHSNIRIRTNCPSDLSQILTAACTPLKAEWWQDREVKHSGNIWACFYLQSLVPQLSGWRFCKDALQLLFRCDKTQT